MQPIQDSDLLNKLKSEDNASFTILYKFYFPSIATFIIHNYGKREDAEDIFQEAITVLLQKVRQPDFVLSSSLKTYLFAIAKNLWLKRLRDHKRLLAAAPDNYLQADETSSVELLEEKSDDEKIISWINKITRHCQQILQAIFFYGEPMKDVMKRMGWKNKHTAANQQYKCIQQVKRERLKEKGA